MNNLSTRELLYLEDASKMFESVAKNCDYAANTAVDPQFKSYMQSISRQHRQWISEAASIVGGTTIQ